jgi:glycerol uptake facilitator-like aquaporin
VYALGKVSGCHINPAVTFALATTKRFPWREVPVYWAAQVVGAVLGALAIWGVFAHQAIDLGMGMTSFNEDTTTWAAAMMNPNANEMPSRSAPVIAGFASPARASVATTDPGPTRTSRAVPSVSAAARWPSEYESISPPP